MFAHRLQHEIVGEARSADMAFNEVPVVREQHGNAYPQSLLF